MHCLLMRDRLLCYELYSDNIRSQAFAKVAIQLPGMVCCECHLLLVATKDCGSY